MHPPGRRLRVRPPADPTDPDIAGPALRARAVSRVAAPPPLTFLPYLRSHPILQAEIFTTTSYGTEVFLFRGHKGFVRMALRHRARLVPILSMGEWELMDNVSWPKTQAFTRKLLGFPVPFAPYGKPTAESAPSHHAGPPSRSPHRSCRLASHLDVFSCGRSAPCYCQLRHEPNVVTLRTGAFMLPMPRRPKHGVTVLVGRPIDCRCEKDTPQQGGLCEPSDADVDRVHALYFSALEGMFERHKAACGFPNHTLVMLDKKNVEKSARAARKAAKGD